MEIHSSSLASIPAGYNRNKSKDNSTLSKDQATLPSPQQQPQGKANDFKAEDVKQLSDNIDKQQKTITNTRTSQAVNAYVQQNTQPLKDQRTDLVSRIDLFA